MAVAATRRGCVTPIMPGTPSHRGGGGGAATPASAPAPTVAAPLAPGEFQTVMPCTMYAGMSEEDLGAIFEYLRTVQPMDNTVERFTGPTEKKM